MTGDGLRVGGDDNIGSAAAIISEVGTVRDSDMEVVVKWDQVRLFA